MALQIKDTTIRTGEHTTLFLGDEQDGITLDVIIHSTGNRGMLVEVTVGDTDGNALYGGDFNLEYEGTIDGS